MCAKGQARKNAAEGLTTGLVKIDTFVPAKIIGPGKLCQKAKVAEFDKP